MKVVVMGAGIIGVSTAWYLLEQGHDVTVIDRQKDAALETSFANGAQISVSFCEPWANAGAPFKVAKWLLSCFFFIMFVSIVFVGICCVFSVSMVIRLSEEFIMSR